MVIHKTKPCAYIVLLIHIIEYTDSRRGRGKITVAQSLSFIWCLEDEMLPKVVITSRLFAQKSSSNIAA